jgi:AraC family transcriptional regulator
MSRSGTQIPLNPLSERGRSTVDSSGVPQKIALDFAHGPSYAVRLVDYPSNLHQRVHTHDRPSVSVVLRGVIEESSAHRTDCVQPLSVIVRAAGVPHADVYGPSGCKTLQIALPAEMPMGELDLPNHRVTWLHNGGQALRSLLQLLKGSPQMESSAIGFALCEVLAEVAEGHALAGDPPGWLVRVKELIDNSSPLTSWSLRDLQRQSGVHPVHVTRQFRRYYKCTIREYLKYRRVRAAVALVAESSLTLTEVAHHFAYADQAHFCRAFRAIAHLTAGDYRQLVRSVATRNVEIVQLAGATPLPS